MRHSFFYGPGFVPGRSAFGVNSTLEAHPDECKMGSLEDIRSEAIDQTTWKIGRKDILARRIYGGILCELWHAIVRGVLQ